MGRGAILATAFWLVFLFVSLLALVALLFPDLRIAGDSGENLTPVEEARQQIEEVLEPAEEVAGMIRSSQARRMEAFYSFFLLGDPAARLRYREARESENAALDSLDVLIDVMRERELIDSLGTRLLTEKTATVRTLSLAWHVSHAEILDRDLSEVTPSPSEYRPLLSAQLRTYVDLRSASESLGDALSRETRAGEVRVSQEVYRQTTRSQTLVIVALVATLVVLVLAWRLRNLIKESERRRVEAMEARQEADALLRATGDGILGMDMEGRCTFLNRAGAEILGYTSLSVVGGDVHGLFHHSRPNGEPLPRDECPILQALEKGEVISGRNETLWRAGRKPFPVQISLRPMMDRKEVQGAVLSFMDMTETRAAEASLRQAVQARDEVLAVVSHDLRNPVGTIISGASLLLSLDPPPEKRREHLLAMKRSAQRINRLIQDLMDVARLEAGVLPVHPGPFHAERLLHEVREANRRQAEEEGVTLAVRVPGPIPQARGDRHRIHQVLTNLVENALRECSPGDSITLGVREPPGGEDLHFSVTDTGPGIEPEDQERLFDRFWQVSRKDKGGAGLGLSIVKGIVEAHEGEVWVESEPGQGSTFWFSLPEGPDEES